MAIFGTTFRSATLTTAVFFGSMAFGTATLLATRAASADENRGTVEQQLACTPDVFKFCGSEIPDTDRIVACLRQNTTQLSSGCRSVFESNASMPPSAAATPATPNRVQSRTLPQSQR